MNKILHLLSFFVFFSVDLFGQYCGVATTNITITPTTTNQQTPPYTSGRRAFNFTATAGCTYVFETCGYATQDTYLRLYSTGTGGVLLAENDDACGTQSRITWTCTTNGTYSILLTRWSCNTLSSSSTRINYRISSCGPPPTPPSNDACSNATPLPCGTSDLAGTTVNSVVETAPSGCASQRGVWYTFTGDGQQTTLTSPTTFDHELTIVSGSCGSFTNIVCVDNSTSTESYTFTTTNGLTYYVYVAHWSTTSTTTGTFNISRSCTPPPTPPANDACINATPLPCGTSNLSGTTVNSVSEISPGGCASQYGVWYTFTGDGQTTTISSTGAGLDQEMVILTGNNCSSLTPIVCVDVTFTTTGVESYSFSTVNGMIYYVYVAHWSTTSTTTGNFTISRTCSSPTISDCSGATQICNDQSFSGNSSGFGTIQELNNINNGCLLGNEHQSSWYYFIPTANGTISMTIQTSVDYDFAMWEGTNCSNLGTPIRCSWSATNGNTGLGNGATDNTENDLGNSWVAPLNVTTGIFYIMVIDNYTADNASFTIDFTFSTPNLLNCTPTPLPIDLLSFTGENIGNENVLNWVTASEINNDEFRIEHSSDTQNWKTIDYVIGNNSPSMYEFIDSDYRNVVNYYRLIQIDFDGTEHYQGTIAIDNTIKGKEIIGIYNILGQEVDHSYKGWILIKYSDNTIIKTYR